MGCRAAPVADHPRRSGGRVLDPDPRHRRRHPSSPCSRSRCCAGDRVVGGDRRSRVGGTGKFDEEDQRMLEVLASHAAVAFVNAKLLQAERESAEASSALLRLLSQALTTIDTGGGHPRRGAQRPCRRSMDPCLEPLARVRPGQRERRVRAHPSSSFLGPERARLLRQHRLGPSRRREPVPACRSPNRLPLSPREVVPRRPPGVPLR